MSLPFCGLEDRGVERLLLLALGDAGEHAAVGLAWPASIEYFLATALQDWPLSSALRAASALASVFVSTMRRSRFSGVANLDLFLS